MRAAVVVQRIVQFRELARGPLAMEEGTLGRKKDDGGISY